jgi:N-acetylglucosaminyldiphosphoundecaprenol N-acetyl-beta-D-mannosaminyltransferase
MAVTTIGENILGYRITLKNTAECVEQIHSWMASGEMGKYFVCVNPHSLRLARGDPLFHQALQKADLLIPDGIGIIIASKILGGNIRERITGSDIFSGICRSLNEQRHYRCFFLGSIYQTLTKIVDKMKVDFPNIAVVGLYSPPFKSEFSPDDDRLIIEAINRVKPDVLWVGMTAPKQEKWIYRNKDHLDVKFIGAVGAVFDFYAGNVKRSPQWFLDHGLEWLPRLVQEPKRLWKRTLISAPLFLTRVIAERLRNGL